MNQKASDAFKTISEVAALIDVPPHVLRFWETKFVSLRPLKRSGGRRYYRPDDVAVLQRIRALLYEDGFTIKGAQKLVKGKASLAEPFKNTEGAVTSRGHIGDAVAILGEVCDRLAAMRHRINK